MNSIAPVNAGHTYANAAEGYEDREAWNDAVEAHQKAAEHFQKALDYTQDSEAGKSLRLLVANHTRRAKDMERKVAKLKSEQEQRQESNYSQRAMMKDKNEIRMDGLLQALPTSLQGKLDKNRGYESLHHGTIGESYALLSTDNCDEEDDPFNKFLRVVETLVDHLSNPVAFASAPLNEDDIPTPYHQKLLSVDDPSIMMESFFLVPDKPNTTDEALQTENEQLKYLVEQLTRRIQSLEKTAEESNMLKSSILQFRYDVQRQAKRIMQTQDSMRASSGSIQAPSGSIQAPSGSIQAPSGSIQAPSGSIQAPSRYPGSTAELVTRLKETEDENRRLKDQIDKQQLLMTKYRERWEKLKESAKKRRAHPSESSDHPPRPPALLRTLAQQSASAHYPPFASSSLAKSSRIGSDNP